MICENCGIELPDNAKFCGICGRKLKESFEFCQKCGAQILDNGAFCIKCGAPKGAVIKMCQNCGFVLAEKDVFCGGCGLRVRSISCAPDNSSSFTNEVKNIVSGKKIGFKSDDEHWTPFSVAKSLCLRNKLILIVALILVIAIAIIGVSLANVIYSNSPSGILAAGMRYLNDLEYGQAVIEFDKVLQIDPKNVDAYVNMADALVAMGDIEGALEVLREGYELTKSEEILGMINKIKSLDVGVTVGYTVTTDYNPLPNVKVKATMIADSSAFNFALDDLDISAEVGAEYITKTNSYGFWSLELPRGLYEITFERNGYISTVIYCEAYPGMSDITENIILYANSYSRKDITSEGRVINGLNYLTVENAEVKFRHGWDKKSGDYVRDENGKIITSVTDYDGYFSVNLPCGLYTAEISKEGFTTSYMNISASEYFVPRLVITPFLSENDYRIVLTWGETPSDLDSHFIGEYDGREFEIYYQNKNLDNILMLDIDDTSSFGPETITIKYDSSFGDCSYFVYDYSNGGNYDSKALSNSRARIIVYRGNNLVGTYNVPTRVDGTVWHVFSIIDGEMVTDNFIDNSIKIER